DPDRHPVPQRLLDGIVGIPVDPDPIADLRCRQVRPCSQCRELRPGSVVEPHRHIARLEDHQAGRFVAEVGQGWPKLWPPSGNDERNSHHATDKRARDPLVRARLESRFPVFAHGSTLLSTGRARAPSGPPTMSPAAIATSVAISGWKMSRWAPTRGSRALTTRE